MMYDLAWKMSKDNNDILWYEENSLVRHSYMLICRWAIVGLTDQYAHHKIDQYVLYYCNIVLLLV